MNQKNLLKELSLVEKVANKTKIARLFYNPKKYFDAIWFREVVYRKHKKSKIVETTLFFEQKMKILLPSSTDIFLTGGKAHDSEIRLARFLIQELQEGQTFIDVGAHYGYFSLLANQLVGLSGKVIAFEPTPNSFEILKKNTITNNIIAINHAVSDKNEKLSFFVFPNQYSEYNTMEVEQFETQEWYQKFKPSKLNIEAIVLSDYLIKNKLKPSVIKIDVEGAENKVISGLNFFLEKNSPTICMEYLSNNRFNSAHQKALEVLKSVGYSSYVIDKQGCLEKIETIDQYLSKLKIESDNIVCKRNYAK